MADNTELHEKYFPQIETPYPKIYAYRIDERPGQIKVGFTTEKDYKVRIVIAAKNKTVSRYGSSALLP